jgi:hypothetical protein
MPKNPLAAEPSPHFRALSKMLTLVLAAVFLLNAQATKRPEFSDFTVPVRQAKRAAPKIPWAKRKDPGFLAVLADADKPPNFAGKYVISKDTCGTDTIRVMIADAVSGTVREVTCLFRDSVNRWLLTHLKPIDDALEFHADSSLLIARGCWDWDPDPDIKPACGIHFFKMTPRGLVEIKGVRPL